MILACALFWFGIAGFGLAMLGLGVGAWIAAYCWLAAVVVMVFSW